MLGGLASTMAKNYPEALRTIARKLSAASESSLTHPTGRGDHREQLFLAELRVRLGSAFDAVKAEIIDSHGRSAGEYDAVVYDNRTGACVTEESGRRIIRVESAIATIEVKSALETKHLEKLFAHQNKEILQLNRHYDATWELRFARSSRPDQLARDIEKLQAGINPMDSYENVPQVVSLIFAFDGLSAETMGHHLQLPGIDAVCVLNKYTVAKARLGYSSNPSDGELWAEGEDALGAFFFLIEQAQENYLEGTRFVRPQWRRYFFAPEPLAQPKESST